MSTAAVIALIVVAIVVVIAVIAYARSRSMHRKRDEAARHRALAEVGRLDAQQKAAVADELAARARQQQLAADQQRMEAQAADEAVVDLEDRANELDPDVEHEPHDA